PLRRIPSPERKAANANGGRRPGPNLARAPGQLHIGSPRPTHPRLTTAMAGLLARGSLPHAAFRLPSGLNGAWLAAYSCGVASALQIFAPGWAVMAMAARYFDPIAIAPVCSEHPKLDGNSAARHGHEPVSIGDILRQSPGISVKQSANC